MCVGVFGMTAVKASVLQTFGPEMLSGQNALVSGGSRGIGRAVCLALAGAGASVGVGFERDSAAAGAVVESAAALGSRAVTIQVDVANPDAARRFIEQGESALGPLDIVINCAGTWPEAKAWDLDDDAWQRTLAVNLSGTFYVCKAASRSMIERRNGKIVNFSSIAAVRGARSGHADYAAAKGGIVSLTRSLANELGPFNINVNAVAPGMIRTDMTRQALQAREDDYRSQTALGRIGLPDDVAGAVLFLVSPAAGYMTGQTIHVDGGM
jgi:3-oxoacyl-[acyl-carrier protein] reductase